MNIKNKEKGFTLIEMVITIAVSVIVLGMIASLSMLTNKITANQKMSSNKISQFSYAKNQIEHFMQDYSSDNFSISTKNQIAFGSTNPLNIATVVSITEKNTEMEIARLEYFKDKISFFKLNDLSEFEMNSSIDVSTFENISFEISKEFHLLRCDVSIKNLNNYTFLINLGGSYLGN